MRRQQGRRAPPGREHHQVGTAAPPDGGAYLWAVVELRWYVLSVRVGGGHVGELGIRLVEWTSAAA